MYYFHTSRQILVIVKQILFLDTDNFLSRPSTELTIIFEYLVRKEQRLYFKSLNVLYIIT